MEVNPLEHPIMLVTPRRLTPLSAWHEHIPFAMFLVDLLRPRVLVELGTHAGDSYCAFCQAVQYLELDARCYAIDTWEGDPHAGFYGPEILADLRAHHDPLYGSFSCLVQSRFDDAVARFPDGTVDLLHIDGYHTYDAVRDDFETWHGKMSERGVVLFHDINVLARDFGVKRLWHELTEKYSHFEFLHGYGLGLLSIGTDPPPGIRRLLEATGDEAARVRSLFFELGHRLGLRVQRDAERADSQRVLEATRGEIAGLTAQRGELQGQLRHLEAERVEEEQRLQARLRHLEAERAEEERRLHARLRHLEAERADGDQRLREMKMRLDAVEAEHEARRGEAELAAAFYRDRLDVLAAIERSRAWRIVSSYRRLIERVLPNGTRRRLLYGRLVAAARTNGGTDGAAATLARVDAVRDRTPLENHTANAEIIVCVHNAFDDVVRCLDSVRLHTSSPYTLVLVDDGSEAQTRDYLADFARLHGAKLFRNEHAVGYTRAANQGLGQTSGEYVVLLNSDTVVTPGWLDRMIACAESDPRIGLVGPLSNTASWQSIPEFEENGDWARNPLPSDVTVEEMARLLARYSRRLYPAIPFLNGFCLLIRRAVLRDVGHFDEERFAAGYGEENDYCLRIRSAGWTLAIADDAFVYHAQSRSYSDEARKRLGPQAMERLIAKHGRACIDDGVAFCRTDRVLEGIRARSRVMVARGRAVADGRLRFAGRRILFVLPITSVGGGGNVVVAEASAMRAMGVDVALFNLAAYRREFETSYPGLDLPVVYGAAADVPHVASSYDAVIATAWPSVYWLPPKAGPQDGVVCAYYVQDFEPDFFSKGTDEYQRALRSYTHLPGLITFTKTTWNREKVMTATGAEAEVIGPSVDIDLFQARSRRGPEWPQRPLRVAAMVRPESPRRAPGLTMHVMHRLSHRYGSGVEIVLFGTTAANPGFQSLPRDFAYKLAGVLEPRQMAQLLNEVDIFADFSAYQAMGLTALEAMACGVATLLPARGGTSDFARHEKNCLVVDSASLDACWLALERLVGDHDLRSRIRRQAVADACSYFPERAALAILNVIVGKSKASSRPRPEMVA